MRERVAEPLLGGLVFPEGARWHDGRLYVSDMHGLAVLAVGPGDRVEVVCEVPGHPSGLGWLPDGRMLVVSMRDRRILRLDGDSLVVHADLAALVPWFCNDMLVDPAGRAYVGNFGSDLAAGEPLRPTVLVAVEPDGSARVAADGLRFPNGTVLADGGRTLVVAETRGPTLTAFDVDGDGALSGRRTWARFAADVLPDGTCIDAEGAIWAASPSTGEVLRVREGGEVVDRATVAGGLRPYACALGGGAGTTLFVCAAGTHVEEEALARRGGVVAVAEVDVPAV